MNELKLGDAAYFRMGDISVRGTITRVAHDIDGRLLYNFTSDGHAIKFNGMDAHHFAPAE
jgi:hypothetical protein